MCGIVGLVSVVPSRFAPGVDGKLVAMRDTLTHRGPDDAGLYLDIPDDIAGNGACGLAFRRLSILDLSTGHQPLSNEDGTVWVAFNGEIYNHLELRQELEAAGHRFATHTDTEVLVHGWEQWGDKLLPRLNGMFDLALWDGRTRTLLLARDRFGKKPLFVAGLDGGRTLVFGSELSAVLAHPGVERRLDPRGLESLLLFDYVASPHALIQDVATLEPGTAWRFEAAAPGGPQLMRLRWHEPSAPDADLANLNDDESLAELDRRIAKAVERRLMADVPLGIFLSGGIDSSLVAWYAARLRPAAELDTFAIGFDDASFDESSHARTVARHLGTRHHERILSPDACLQLVPDLLGKLDQPLADASILPTWFLSKFAREQVTVALGGDGGDEWFLGYPTFYAHHVGRLWDHLGMRPLQPAFEAMARHLPVSHGNLSLDFQIKRFLGGLRYDGGMRHVAWIGGLEPRQHARVLHPDLQARLSQLTRGVFPWTSEDLQTEISQTWHEWRALGRDDMDGLAALYARYYLGDGVLQKVDRASMLHSLEVRAPLLDPDVVQLARALPTRAKLRGRTTKIALRRLAEQKLPADIVRRPKKGFGVPLASWLRGPLKAWMTDQLTGETVRSSPHLNAQGIAAVVDEHVRGKADHRKVLWALLCFVAWQERVRAS